MGPRQRQGRSRSKTHALPIILLSFLGFLLIAGVAFGIGMVGNVNRWLSDLPDYTDANAYLVSEPTEIVDCNGNKIASFYTQNRKSITKDEVSPYVLQGTVDVEDERFYEHGGIDLWGIARAAVATLGGGHEGASTITQQLVRNTILQEEQFDSTIERKVREAYIAVKMEDMYSKDEILMMYLNTIYYGHGAYGIEAAAETYLSKSAADLTLSEAALLIGLPNSPSQYDPTVNPDLALSRRNKVLDNMLRLGHITQEEHDAAQAEPITLNVTEISGSGVDVYSQPYFVAYVKQLLEQEFSTDVLFKGGLTVKTTIDPTMQQVAENAVRQQLDTLSLDGLDMGMVVVDPKTGYIKCMVGGYDYNADENHVNHATAKRPVGSTFKAFTLATAIQNGMNPNVTLNCNSPLKAKGTTTEVQNYANHSYGNITLKQATAYSSNTGYIQVAEAVGNSKIISLVKKLGIDPATGKLPEGVAAQTEQSLKNIRALLAAAGAGIENVVKTTVFITNMAQYAIRGYAVGALDYVLKPVPYFAFSQQLQKALGQLEKRERHYLAVAVDGGMRRLDAAEIYYLESEGHKVHFYTEKEDFMVPGTLKNYEEKLVGRAFARCNSGYLVNLAQVSGVQQDMVQVGPYTLQISRPRRKAFMAGLADYIGGAG